MLPPRMYVGRAALIALLPAPATTSLPRGGACKVCVRARVEDPKASFVCPL